MTYQQLQIYKVLQNALSQISRTNDPTFQINCLSVEKKVNIILFNFRFENAYITITMTDHFFHLGNLMYYH